MQMRHLLRSTAIFAVVTGAATVGQAQDFSFSGGATLTSRYVANGLEQSDGPAFQPWAEVETGGFYLGFWASNTTRSIVGGSSELNVMLGFRNEVGGLAYDVGYARYIYFGPRKNCCGELYLNLDATLADAFSLGTSVKYDPTARVSNISMGAGLALDDALSFDANIGKISRGGQRYWSMGATYTFNDSVSASLAWHDTNISRGLAVLSVDYSFSIR
jgi:uncharacterized protein (TIGR02001 family)